MTNTGIASVLLSAVAHAAWNFLFKRAGGTPAFIGLSKIAEVALLAPVFVWLALPAHALLPSFVWMSMGGAAFTLAGYVLLSAAYAKGDLGFVYPVARGSILCFLPVLGALLLHERVDATGALAITSLVTGVLVMQLPTLTLASLRDVMREIRSPATVLALGAGLATAGATLWDKQAIQALPRFTYYFGYTAVIAACYAAYLGRRSVAPAAHDTWRQHRVAIVVVGLLNTLSYMLILVALKHTTSSYVIGLRQLSIGVGTFLGYWLLRESLTRPRLLGVGLLLAGCVLIPLAR